MSETCSEEVCGWVDKLIDSRSMAGWAWWCGDEYCDCSHARIATYTPSGYGGMLGVKIEWSGTFRTDGEDGASTELNRMAQHLRRHHHDLYSKIQWPWSK